MSVPANVTEYLPILRCTKDFKKKVLEYKKKHNTTYAKMIRYAFKKVYKIN